MGSNILFPEVPTDSVFQSVSDVSLPVEETRQQEMNREVSLCKECHVVRWYVLVLPACHRGSSSSGLREEMERRARRGEPVFEYFAPSYVEVKRIGGKLVNTQCPLLYNYVFIHASEAEIYRMKQFLPQYNFLPRVKAEKGGRSYYPYLSDAAMENLQWIARSYSDVLPVYSSHPERLVKGDKVRITEGQFKGVEATVAIQPGAGKKDIMVCIENWMWVPLLHIQPGQYEIISLNDSRKHVYTNLDNERISCGLHEALGRYHAPGGVNEADRALASEALRLYEGLEMPTDVMRCKLYSILLPAYTVLGDKENAACLAGTMHSILPAVKAEQSRALLLVTLYGCTDSSIYHGLAHALVSPWRRESNPKKSKRQLLQRLDDYDRWLGH